MMSNRVLEQHQPVLTSFSVVIFLLDIQCIRLALFSRLEAIRKPSVDD